MAKLSGHKNKESPGEMHFQQKAILAEETRGSTRSDIWAVSEVVSVLSALPPALPRCATAAGTARGNAANELKASLI